jgi:TfoX/Sxy family transcriptional regulator of competence genes
MAYDEGLASLLRDDLADMHGIDERRMFGGLCFLWNGHMIAGVTADGGMFRVGKPREAEALAIDGAAPLSFTGRPMDGLIEVTDEAMADDARRADWLALVLENARSLPPKA